jgi:hypothetical protein
MRGSHRGLALAARQALEKLTRDDSRRVAAAAEQALEAYPEASSLAVDAIGPGKTEKESMEPAESAPAVQFRMEQTPQPQAKADERAAEPRIVTGQPEAAIAVAPRAHPVSKPALTQALVGLLHDLVRKSLLVVAAGWALGGIVGIYWSWTKNPGWGLVGFALIPATTTGLVLWGRRRRFAWLWTALLCAAFVLALALFDQLKVPVSDLVSAVFGKLADVEIAWKVGWWFGFVLAGVLSGTVVGVAIALGLRKSGLSLSKRPFWTIVLGWALGIALFGLGGEAFGEVTNWESLVAVVAGYALGGLIGGAIGGLIMFSQLAIDAAPGRSLSPAAEP